MTPQTKPIQAAPKYTKVLELDLSGDGKKATKIGIIDARGKHVIQAQRYMDGDEAKWFPALMHVVCRVDDAQQPIEFYEEMRMGPFMQLMTEIGVEGFIE